MHHSDAIITAMQVAVRAPAPTPTTATTQSQWKMVLAQGRSASAPTKTASRAPAAARAPPPTPPPAAVATPRRWCSTLPTTTKRTHSPPTPGPTLLHPVLHLLLRLLHTCDTHW